MFCGLSYAVLMSTRRAWVELKFARSRSYFSFRLMHTATPPNASPTRTTTWSSMVLLFDMRMERGLDAERLRNVYMTPMQRLHNVIGAFCSTFESPTNI
jgi:hypothetical protein